MEIEASRAFRRLSGNDAVLISSKTHGDNIGHSFDLSSLLALTSETPIFTTSPKATNSIPEMCRTTRSNPSAMSRFLGQQGLIVGGGAWRCRFLVEMATQIGPMVIGQEVQWCLGLAPCRQDALDRCQGKGAVLHRPLQRLQDIPTRISHHQRQHPFRLVPAVTRTSQQTLQEPRASLAELGKLSGQLFRSSLSITRWGVLLEMAALSRGTARKESMSRRGDE